MKEMMGERKWSGGEQKKDAMRENGKAYGFVMKEMEKESEIHNVS